MTLAGRTAFISGASRGIGLAIAKRVAADGANIALMAKNAQPHPKLPGSQPRSAASGSAEVVEVGWR
jgi:NAD(P)-dependent dehydrogenase (short-subunit alcohol dehydrogenase family)